MALHRCVTNNGGQLYLTIKANCREAPWRYGADIVHQHTNITFYSSFEQNCRQIINYSLPPSKKLP